MKEIMTMYVEKAMRETMTNMKHANCGYSKE